MADGPLLSFLRQDPVFGAEWSDIEYKAAIDCLGANKLLTPAQLANIRLEELSGSEGLPAGVKGVLRRALERATTAGKQVAYASAPGEPPWSARSHRGGGQCGNGRPRTPRRRGR